MAATLHRHHQKRKAEKILTTNGHEWTLKLRMFTAKKRKRRKTNRGVLETAEARWPQRKTANPNLGADRASAVSRNFLLLAGFRRRNCLSHLIKPSSLDCGFLTGGCVHLPGERMVDCTCLGSVFIGVHPWLNGGVGVNAKKRVA